MMKTTKPNTTMDENFSFVRNSRGNFSSKSKNALKFLNRNDSGKIDSEIDFINLDDFHSNYGDDELDEASEDSFETFINSSTSTVKKSPYRTLSHFGFNAPEFLQPNHFHFPVYPTKYIPIKRKATVDDLFSTERYLNCSDLQLRTIWEKKVRKSIYNSANNSFEMSDGKRLKLSPPSEILEESKSDSSSDGSSGVFHRIFENVLNEKRKKFKEKFSFEYLDTPSTLVDESSYVNFDDSDDFYDSQLLEQERDQCSLFLNSVFDKVSQRRPSLERNKSLTTIDEEDETTLMKSNDDNNNFIKQFVYEIVDQIPDVTHISIEPSTTFINKISEMNYSSESPNLDFDGHTSDYEIKRVPPINKVLRRSPREIRKRKFMEMIDEHRSRSSESETELVEDELNSIEKLILTKIEKNNFDRNEGSIFQKIEQSILSKIKSPIYTSSTPMEKSLRESFCSSNLSEVDDDWENDFISGNATLRTKSKESGICDFEGSSDDDKIKSTTFIKDLTGLTISATAKHSICPKLDKKVSPKTPSTPKRNFITENIRNVVLMKNFHSPRPAVTKKSVSATPNIVKPLHSFKTKESKKGSPCYWLSASPRIKTGKPVNGNLGVRKITPRKPQQTVKDVIETETSDEIYQPDPDKPQNKICFSKDYILDKSDENSIQELEEDMKKCCKTVCSIGAHVEEVGAQLDELKEKFNEILDLQKEIDEERTEFRQSISDVHERFESLVFTSEDEDLLI